MTRRVVVLVKDDQLQRIEDLARRVGLGHGPAIRLLAGIGLEVAERDPTRLVPAKETKA